MDLERIVAELAPRLLACCFAWTRDRSLAEETAQEALTALVQRWRRFGPPECPEAFAFAIARRRAARARLKQRLLAPLSILFERRSPHRNPEDQAADRADLARVRTALAELSGRDRTALLAVAVAELPLAEGARSLGISVSALKMRLHRARRRLVQAMEMNDAT
ncbi:MAG TPA: sigma-70 family RNA polymerase sigma factor [Thermoanaerobaculia bacterium]|jgi:RNA polymerase sigma-70 factor (ECF subfamily)|nr:sigma-70 family RNA polymerase sigma factor [Thermoanaerobaculia bacterium]